MSTSTDVQAAECAAEQAEEELVESSLRLGFAPVDTSIVKAHARAQQLTKWARAAEQLGKQLYGDSDGRSMY